MVDNMKELMLTANKIRQDVIEMLVEAGSGHSAGPLGMADVFTALYFNHARINPKKPWDENRDRIVLSNGHICPVWYATLAERGFFPVRELKTLRKINSRLQGHPHARELPGIENSGGPLGQGCNIGVGMALAGKMDKKNWRVYALLSDGELNEGCDWEAFMLAAKYELDNLCFIIDRNNIQIEGPSDKVMPLEPLKKKLESFNLHVIEVNGNDFKQVLNALEKAGKTKGMPTAIIAKTTPGKGVSFMENDYKWHGKPPNKEEAEKALKELRRQRTELL
ncbi:transketolase [Candidatus Micrarchaeota archaeon]|nr:transketolase [Candidatus Micrarchaeota archaeon]